MNTRTTLTAICAAAALLAPALLGCTAAHASALNNRVTMDHHDNKQEPARLHVRGSAELDKPADELRISIGVVTEHADPSQALSQNTRRMRAVVEAIEHAGLSDKEYQTGRFQIRPVWSQRPPRQQADAEWRPQIVAYSVTNTINIKTKQLEKAGEIIQAANKAGANTIDAIQFTLSDPRVHRAEAIAVATANARADAEALAAASGVRLVRVVEVRLDDAQAIRPPQHHEYARNMAMSADSAPPIAPGEVSVQSSVNLVYEIAPIH
jgi:uncharacterized protein YggE